MHGNDDDGGLRGAGMTCFGSDAETRPPFSKVLSCCLTTRADIGGPIDSA